LLGFTSFYPTYSYIFTKDNVEEIINIQPKGSEAKSYQVKQVRNLVLKYSLGDSDVSEI